MLAADLHRFWSKVDRTGECWLWTGARNDRGYGQLRVAGRAEYAHRIAVHIAGRALPRNAIVLHRCDNPRCVRPDHLIVGTHTENMRDMVRKGRSAHKLTSAAVARVRRLSAAGLSRREVASRVGASPSQIQNIVSGRQRADRI